MPRIKFKDCPNDGYVKARSSPIKVSKEYFDDNRDKTEGLLDAGRKAVEVKAEDFNCEHKVRDYFKTKIFDAKNRVESLRLECLHYFSKVIAEIPDCKSFKELINEFKNTLLPPLEAYEILNNNEKVIVENKWAWFASLFYLLGIIGFLSADYVSADIFWEKGFANALGNLTETDQIIVHILATVTTCNFLIFHVVFDCMSNDAFHITRRCFFAVAIVFALGFGCSIAILYGHQVTENIFPINTSGPSAMMADLNPVQANVEQNKFENAQKDNDSLFQQIGMGKKSFALSFWAFDLVPLLLGAGAGLFSVSFKRSWQVLDSVRIAKRFVDVFKTFLELQKQYSKEQQIMFTLQCQTNQHENLQLIEQKNAEVYEDGLRDAKTFIAERIEFEPEKRKLFPWLHGLVYLKPIIWVNLDTFPAEIKKCEQNLERIISAKINDGDSSWGSSTQKEPSGNGHHKTTLI